MEDTIFWLSQPGIHEDLAEADAATARGDTVPAEVILEETRRRVAEEEAAERERRAGWTYRVVVTGPAERGLNRLPPKVHLAIAEFINGPLVENPHRVGKVPRDDPTERYTARVGVHRIIYWIDDKIRVISVMRIGHRADIYWPS